ncbi:MAG TPA: alpha-ribazole phosphatase [Clostridiales bacterium]|jgi:broad specificity phosphatase PhoE|nr:alpha-ribazole phosphatase [Clostridiales bacterium]
MYIYLIRHGETIWNAAGKTQGTRNIPLSDRGVQQADALADRLSGEKNLSALFCSDLNRAYQTAAVLGNKLGMVPEKEETLQEICFGDWEGFTIRQIGEKYPGQLTLRNTDFDFSPPGGESIQSARERVHCFLTILQGKHFEEESRIVIVAHAFSARLLLLELMDFPLEFLWNFRLDNAGISLLQRDSHRKRVLYLNDTCHLHRT